MNKKSLLATIVSFLMLSAFIPAISAVVGRPDHLIIATIGEPETVDPAWLYDTASAELGMNVYDTLINFKVDRTAPREDQGKTDEFVPGLATSWTISGDGKTYTFTIREGVLFHNGATLTPGDIEYSLERWMVQDRAGGPTWMILEPLLQAYGTELTAAFAQRIDNAVTSTATTVTLHLDVGFPMMIVMQTLAQSWAGILNKEWCVAQGCFPGFDVTGYDPAVWGEWNDPEVSELDDPTPRMMGTGPYELDYWDKGIEWSIVWFPDHWQGWPPIPWEYQGGGYPEGWLKRVTEKFISEWATRKMMFLACDVDFCYVPRMHTPELVLNWPTKPEIYVPGIRCDRELPTIVCSPCMFYSYDVDPSSGYLGPGFDPNNPHTIAEDRMRVDMFSDVDVRKAFSYAFDYDTYLRDVYLGEADRCISPVVDTLPYHNPAQAGYDYNLALAEDHLRAAWGGALWDQGFTLGIAYNTRNVPRFIATEMVKSAIESLNPKFHILTNEIPWPQYLKELVSFQLTAFVIGWLADYPDPHNFVFPFMHTEGTFAYFQRYSNPTVDALIADGIATPDGPERQAIYYELQRIYVEDCPGVPLAKPTGRHWEKDWIMGWYYNPIYPGGYFKHYWKGYSGDMDRDYDVDLDDLFLVLIWYCEPDPPAEYDLDHDGHVDLDDLFDVLINYGK